MNIALGAGQVSKAGGARFIDRLRVAADGDPEVLGSLKAAHFLRLTQGGDGQTLSMGQIVRNVRSTDYSNASMVKALYSPTEWAEIRRLASSLDPLLAKGEFAKSSGTAERMSRMMFQRLGANTPIVGGLVGGVGAIRDSLRAQGAVYSPLRLPARPLPAVPAAAAAYGGQGSR